MKKSIVFVGLILTFVVSSISYAIPIPSFYTKKEFKIKDGLPSQVVNTLLFTDKKQLLVGTQRGLYLFDGYQFVLIDSIDKRVEGLAYRNDTLWIHQSIRSLLNLQFSTREILSVVGLPKYEDGDPNNDHFNNIFFDNAGSLWVSDFEYIKKYDWTTHIFKSLRIYPDNKNLIRPFFVINDSVLDWVFADNGVWNWNKHSDSLSLIKPQGPDKVRAMAAFDQSQYYCVDDHGRFWQFDFPAKSFRFITTIEGGKTARKLIKTGQGVFLLTDHQLLQYVAGTDHWKILYENIENTLNDVVMDDETGICWIASNDGLLQLIPPVKSIQPFTIPSKNTLFIIDIVFWNSDYYLLSNDNQIFYKAGDELKKVVSLPVGDGSSSYSFSVIDGRLIIPKGNEIFELNNQHHLQKIPVAGMCNTAQIKKIIPTSFGEWWLMQEHQPVIKIDKYSMTVLDNNFQNDSNFWTKNKWNDILEVNDKIWMVGWMPQSFGVTYYDTSHHLFVDIAKENINDNGLFVGDYYLKIGTTVNDDLLMSAYGGWNRLLRDGKIVTRIDVINYPIHSDVINGITGMENGDIVFGTSEGLYIYRPVTEFLTAFTENEGMPSNDLVYAFYKRNEDEIALGMKNGMVIIDENSLMETKLRNRLEFTDIRVDGVWKNPAESIHFASDNTLLSLKFSALTYQQQNQIRYRYRYSMDKEWIDIGNNSEIILTHLPYGTYELEIQAGDNLNNWQQKSLKVEIRASPPFLKSNWFYFLLLGTGIGITYMIAVISIRRAKKESALKQKVITSEIKALRAQMNPHFLFNSLNSIQSFIIQEKTEEARAYLTSFSKLLRYILEYTREDLITLEEELKALEIYLYLESARLDHIFEYKIEVDNDLDSEEIKLPPLLIQPFVENAIWHGIRDIDYVGLIIVNVAPFENGIRISIADNGVGRKKSQERQLKAVKRKHFGMSITEERIKLIDERNYVVVSDFDLKDQSGTIVKIFLYNI